jgi:hypothetical protein
VNVSREGKRHAECITLRHFERTAKHNSKILANTQSSRDSEKPDSPQAETCTASAHRSAEFPPPGPFCNFDGKPFIQ